MPQTINTNIASLNAQRNLSTSQSSLATSMQRLSSGMRVNSAKDDAAGLAIAERMSSQVRGMNVAIRNANDGISMAQTAEGAMGKVADALQRMRELAVQSANSTNSESDKESLDQEFGQLAEEIQRVLAGTTFNGKAILGAGAGTAYTFQVGANTKGEDTIEINTAKLTTNADILNVAGGTAEPVGTAAGVVVTAATIGKTAGTTVGTGSSAITVPPISDVIDNLDVALDTINSQRATMGAAQSRFDSVISNLQISVENQSAARSRIMDADFASETANLSRAQILQQAGNAMVAQANALPQQVLKLLQG